MEAKVKTIIGTIIQGTINRSFVWETTERKSEFRLRFQNGIVTIDKWTTTDEQTGQDSRLADITFHNAAGEQVDRLVFEADIQRDDYNELAALHEAARRSILKVDEVLDKLFGEIQQKARDSK
jgi:hypothetical protein